ncbi:hypothetical protein [Halosimplex sp. TS25]|uniref:DUF7269 family protein n=1 Tax=Halosimplex rarum TaxID=3396619 RepID=UPI0039E9364C
MSDRSAADPAGEAPWRSVGSLVLNSRTLRTVAGGLGVLSLVTAIGVAAGVGGPRVADAIGALADPARLFVYLIAHLAVALGLWSLWTARGSGTEETQTTLPHPERADESPGKVLGGDIDETLRRLADPTDTVELRGRIDVERTIRRVAVDVLREEADYDLGGLQAALDEGTWTDDPRAAAYMGDVELPVRIRVIDWASGDPYRRRVQATVAELAAIADVESEVESP